MIMLNLRLILYQNIDLVEGYSIFQKQLKFPTVVSFIGVPGSNVTSLNAALCLFTYLQICIPKQPCASAAGHGRLRLHQQVDVGAGDAAPPGLLGTRRPQRRGPEGLLWQRAPPTQLITTH